jgi:serine/threonine protein kinase/tetratricopeptide (TPR) repeat protein
METPDPADVQRAVGARYEVLDLAGAGGMGAVYRARHRELGHQVAIKVLPPEIASSRMREERFRREAQLSAHLSHPNLVPVFEFETNEGLTYLIMPFVRGQTLEALLAERQQLLLPELLRVLHDVGAALDFIHPRGVVHRDVKPANILIEDETGRALLADFGVALAGVSGGSLTGVGVAIGTPAYLPPEQQTGAERVDGRADLYSLALVAFEALTGDLPVAGLDRADLATALRKQRRDVSPALAAALVAPLAERPSERPETAAVWLHGIGRATGRSWRGPVLAATALTLLGVVAWIAWRRAATHPSAEGSLAVMPFTILGTNAQFPPAQLPLWFQQRVGLVPGLRIVSSPKTASFAGEQALAINDAQTTATQLDATYFVQPKLQFHDSTATMSAELWETKTLRQLGSGTRSGPADSLSQLMDAVWAQLLQRILRGRFAPLSSVTLPNTLPAMIAYANAEEAWRRGNFDRALEEYDRVLAADSSFAIGYFRRAIVHAQVDPREEVLAAAIAGARRHQSGLTPSDSLLLEGYRLILEQGDGRGALRRFLEARDSAPDEPQTWFVLGEFYYHFGALFDQRITEAEASFEKVLELTPEFAPAISHLISLQHMRGDEEATQQSIAKYQSYDSTSVVADAIGIADTLLFHAVPAKLALLKTLDHHRFTSLEYLAFQVQEFGKPDERRGPGRKVLLALARRATTDSQQVLALRLGVAADLGEGWVDSARARLAQVRTPATERERDMWLVLLPAVGGLDSLGPWRDAATRLDAGLVPGRGGEITHWMLARLNVDRARHVAALEGIARDGAPLPLSLKLDLDARRALANGDTARALALWEQATQRYAVLRVPFDHAASLWWLRRDLARFALAHRDTALAARTCVSFTSLIGYVDLLVREQKDQFCPPAIAN